MLSIFLNGETREVAADLDLAALVDSLSLPAKRIAVELNGIVIRRADWAGTPISEGDRIEVVHFVGGG